MIVTKEDLYAFSDFVDVPANQIEWFLEHCEVIEIKKGDKMFKINDPIDKLYIIMKGRVEVKLKRGNNYQTVAVIEPGGINGFLPYSRATTAIAEGLVIEDGHILKLSKDLCREMSLLHYELTAVFVHEMTSRTREFAKSNVQAEKMMALGKLSAGLAHELNNPASAIQRSAGELKKHLGNVPEKFMAVMSMTVQEHQVDALNDLIFQKLKTTSELSLSERSALEDELEDWLDEHEIEDGFELVDSLLDYDFRVEDLEKILEIAGAKDLSPTLHWVGNVLTTEKMVDEIEEASKRISELVQSVKVYTHMDNAPEKVRTDLSKGIKSTLTMLNHKLKKKNIQVETDFDKDLAQPSVMVGEMNQVWTNLIDNAIDAMDDKGVLKLKGRNMDQAVTISVEDNGKGIDKEHLNRIFDPFFTTKGVGEGTGMGLEMVNRIIKQHEGKIKVESEPGKTKFEITIPID
ncbi:ATP-binding protein [Portibacter marinus]|uniref:ATP-binding protein n=1 Tax=Portibacter marinus TaxID=2898660 RepID=UPI001F29530B|nr:ATP-binding protein [Portibacter marinus]